MINHSNKNDNCRMVNWFVNQIFKEDVILWLLKVGGALCFFGWAWQHLRWDVPYREFFWSESLFSWAINLSGMTWEEWVGNALHDEYIQTFVKAMGCLFIFYGLTALFVRKRVWWQYAVLILGSLHMLLIAWLKYLDKMQAFGQFIEYGSQFLILTLVVLALEYGIHHKAVLTTARIAIVLTFAGHGLYAIGFYEVPGHFITMAMGMLRLSESGAILLLSIAGTLDFIICCLIFSPAFARPALYYATAWGFITALARLWSGFNFDYSYWGLDQFLHLMVYRTPHWVVPLFILLATWHELPSARINWLKGLKQRKHRNSKALS